MTSYAHKIVLKTPWTLPGRQEVYNTLKAFKFGDCPALVGYYTTRTSADVEARECSILVISEYYPLNQRQIGKLLQLKAVAQVVEAKEGEIPEAYQEED